MNVRKLSVNKACIFLAVLLLAAMVTVSVALYALPQDITAVWYVLLFGIFVLFCSICFMVLVRRKLVMFSDAFCSLMDDMLSGNMQPKQTVEEESLFYKIEYRLNRLYEVMQENKNSIAQERADLQELISDISHQVKTPIANLKMISILLNAEKKQINVQVNCPESLIVSHDRKWTGEALFNILDNAVKYTPEGGQIRVSVESLEMYVKIDIADTGIGISEQHQGAIFKRFYREDIVHDVDGIGIGLYLAREIVTLQGGYIRVTSEVGKGSTFSVFLLREQSKYAEE